MAHVPAPIPHNETARLEALRECCILDTPADEAFDRIAAIAREVAETPISLVSLVGEMRQWFKARVGLDAQETHRDLAFCAHAILSSEPLVVENALEDPRFAESPLVVGPPHIRFYAGFPLELSSGERLGTLCVIDTTPRRLDDRTRRLLASLGRQTATQLELRRNVGRLERMNDELTCTQQRLRASDRAKSEFLANMSHEIRTPMAAILGYTDILIDDSTLPTGAASTLATIRRNGEHLLSIINDILDLSRIEAGGVSLERVAIDPHDLLRDVCTLLLGGAQAKGLGLHLVYESPVPKMIRTDPLRLRQILVNLLGNAVKFTERGTVHVEVQFDPDADDAPALRIRVRDTGPGIAPEHLETIFEPFRQADATTTRHHGGTGLGLSVSTKLASMLGGRITTESRAGHGSTFTLHLAVDPELATDLVQPRVDDSRPGPASAPAQDTGQLRLDGLRILLAEDGRDNQRLVRHILERAGATVIIASNGAEALDTIETESAACGGFDAVLMDMQMPEMDGYEATIALRERGYRLPVLALTAHAMAGDRERCLAAGCDDYLTKPIDRKTMLRSLRTAVDAPPRDVRAAS